MTKKAKARKKSPAKRKPATKPAAAAAKPAAAKKKTATPAAAKKKAAKKKPTASKTAALPRLTERVKEHIRKQQLERAFAVTDHDRRLYVWLIETPGAKKWKQVKTFPHTLEGTTAAVHYIEGLVKLYGQDVSHESVKDDL